MLASCFVALFLLRWIKYNTKTLICTGGMQKFKKDALPLHKNASIYRAGFHICEENEGIQSKRKLTPQESDASSLKIKLVSLHFVSSRGLERGRQLVAAGTATLFCGCRFLFGAGDDVL